MKISKPRTTKGTALFLAHISMEKLATEVVIADLKKIEFAPAEYFVFCTCGSEAQMRALVAEIENKCSEFSIEKPRVEGLDNAYWVVVDLFDVVLHIMRKDSRMYYQIEKIWGEADFYTVKENERTLNKLKDFSYLS